MAALQSAVFLLLASCLILLGDSEALYPGYYHNDYPLYPYKAYPSYPYGGWPLEHFKGVPELADKKFPAYYSPVTYDPYVPKYDGLHRHYPHVPVFRPIPPPSYFNVYNIFDGGKTKQTATAQASAASSAGGSSRQATSAESAQEMTSSSDVPASLEVSGERTAAASPSPASAPVTVTYAPVSAHKLTVFRPPARVRDHHAAPKAHVTAASVESDSRSAEKLVAAAPAFTNHGWYPHNPRHV
ncbi:uncharacterized protein LOC126203804 [Schistocerca nitens]|uniref:uncharacterized protein LOC126203804 n=1 Tax=Schistocerca nitens TaxID=7011 RepID=UPI002118CF0A|nr:uncharacterized protein LOC126203804 [Schistocerca nitens]